MGLVEHPRDNGMGPPSTFKSMASTMGHDVVLKLIKKEDGVHQREDYYSWFVLDLAKVCVSFCRGRSIKRAS